MTKDDRQVAEIELGDVSYTYPDGRVALREVSLRIETGERLAVIGPNGSGKSTLLAVLNGIREPRSGRVAVQGLPLCKANMAAIRRNVGVVFQDPDTQLFCPTVEEDIAFGLLNLGLDHAEIRRRTEAALEFVGLEGFAGRSPFHLSGGEKKLVSLATVLAMAPPVIALDEPSAGLDPCHRRLLADVLRRLPGTLILATHDLDLAWDLARRVVILYEGRLVHQGTAREVLRDGELLRAFRLELPLRLQGIGE